MAYATADSESLKWIRLHIGGTAGGQAYRQVKQALRQNQLKIISNLSTSQKNVRLVVQHAISSTSSHPSRAEKLVIHNADMRRGCRVKSRTFFCCLLCVCDQWRPSILLVCVCVNVTSACALLAERFAQAPPFIVHIVQNAPTRLTSDKNWKVRYEIFHRSKQNTCETGTTLHNVRVGARWGA